MTVITPIKSNHSIDSCLFFIEFVQQTRSILNPAEIEMLCKVFSDFESHYDPAVGTIVFSKDKTECWRIGLSDTQLELACLCYDRWEHFVDTLGEVIEELIPHLPCPDIHRIGLVYVDRFHVTYEDNFNLRTLFRDPSPYLNAAFLNSQLAPAACYTVDSIFHKGEQWNYSIREMNILALATETDNLDFVLKHTQLLHGKNLSPKTHDQIRAELIGAAHLMHKENKRVIKELLTDSVQNQIGL